jgi:hypothetical protein
MCATAANLIECVLAEVAVRNWVSTAGGHPARVQSSLMLREKRAFPRPARGGLDRLLLGVLFSVT